MNDFSEVVKDPCRGGTDNFEINLQEKTPFLAKINTRNNFTLKQRKANNLRPGEITRHTWKLSFTSSKEAFRFSLCVKTTTTKATTKRSINNVPICFRIILK